MGEGAHPIKISKGMGYGFERAWRNPNVCDHYAYRGDP
jgi:hypothetical protein